MNKKDYTVIVSDLILKAAAAGLVTFAMLAVMILFS